MKSYVVGGAVRDELLGLPVQDRDYVVVGATPEDMIAAGFRPVGRDFPVFLHPQTHEEYALARTERKSGRGYKGFTIYAAPDVTLEQDLERRDLTINAIARDESGRLIDPFGGVRDLKEGVLRHVSDAFHDDPVRILRVARFAARFGFRIDEGTMALMKSMVDTGEADHLVPERVWQEFSRGLGEDRPERMFDALERCDFRPKLLPELKAIPQSFSGPLPVRFAVLCWPVPEADIKALCDRLKVPNDERDLALLACRCQRLLDAVAARRNPEPVQARRCVPSPRALCAVAAGRDACAARFQWRTIREGRLPPPPKLTQAKSRAGPRRPPRFRRCSTRRASRRSPPASGPERRLAPDQVGRADQRHNLGL